MNRYYILITLFFFTVNADSIAQNIFNTNDLDSLFEATQEQQHSDFNKLVANKHVYFNKVSDSAHLNFRMFRDSVNRAFAEFIKQSWQPKELSENIMPELKKPEKQPVFNQKLLDAPVKIKTHYDKSSSKKQAVHQLPFDDFTIKLNDELKLEFQEYAKKAKQKKQFAFYGETLNIFYDELSFELTNVNNITSSKAWTKLSEHNYLPVINQLVQYAKSYKLNDWGYLLLVRELGNKLYNNNNKTTLFTHFILANTGYINTKLAYKDNKLYLIIPSKMKIYRTGKFVGKNYNLYAFDINNVKNGIAYNKVNTGLIQVMPDGFYNKEIPEFNFLHYEPLDFNKRTKTTTLTCEINSEIKVFNINYDAQVVDLYNDFPFCQESVYFSTKLSETALKSIHNQLEPYLKGKNEIQQVEFLLHFVQTAFTYQVDKKQFGYERMFYSEEIFKHPRSDCEDRAILFVQLVNYFTGLETVGLGFKTNESAHMATGVCFNSENITGDSIIKDNKRYFLCDPTYWGAGIGNCIPEYKNATATIIDFTFSKKN